MTVVSFRKVKEPFGWLGNMSPHPVGYAPTAEHLFQCLRFDPKNGMSVILDILKQKSPMAAKMVAKRYLDYAIIKPRSPEDVDNMRKVVGLKIASHPSIAADLALIPKDAQIIEDSTNRPNESGLFWGAALQNGEWVGNNQLGKIWMEYRQLLP